MINQDESELIERYVSGELNEVECKIFEKRMADDEAFREIVNLHHLLFRELGNEHQLGLLNTLQEITEKPYPKTSLLTIRRLIPAILIILACLGFFWVVTSSPSDNPAEPETRPEPASPGISLPITDSSEQTRTTPMASLDPANFRPNPSLEGLIGATLRGDAPVQATFLKPNPASRFFIQNGVLRLVIQGIVRTTDSSATEKGFNLRLYSNRGADFNTEKYLFSAQPTLHPASDSEFRFSATPEIKLKPGLYYVVLTENGYNEPIAVSKFRVEQ